MREILFRAKRIDNGEWVEGYYIYHIKRTICPIGDSVKPEDEQHVIMQDGFSDWNMPRNTVFFNIDPETVCQYTGFTDKNGNRIWENDIVEDKRFNEFYKIVFRVRDGGWYVENIKSGALFRIMERTSYQYERCGNIFDNPELLKGDQSCTDL